MVTPTWKKYYSTIRSRMCDRGSQARQLSPSPAVGVEHDHVAQPGQSGAHLADLVHLSGRGAEHARGGGVAQDVFDLVGGQVGGDRNVGDAGAQACIVGEGPLEPRLREDRDAVTGLETQLPQPERDGAHALLRLVVRHGLPRPLGLIAEGGGVARVAFDGGEEQLGQRARAHGWNLTTKVTESGTTVPTARRALATTTMLSGSEPLRRRTFTLAIPDALVVTVSTSTGACPLSVVTSVTESAA